MPDGSDDRRHVSRRNLFKQVGVVGAAAALSGAPVVEPTMAQTPAAQTPAAPPRREALETLTAAEGETLEAIVARLIPSDANSPGAAEARAAHYIDRALAGPLRASRTAYADGLAALDAYAQAKKGAPFVKLSASDQDAVLTDLEKNVATGFTPNAASFFTLLRTHTIQGTFCDPYYGGNANFAGWDLIGYPGVRLAVTTDEQRLDARPAPTHMSAYDYRMFSGRRPSRAALDQEGGHHGD